MYGFFFFFCIKVDFLVRIFSPHVSPFGGHTDARIFSLLYEKNSLSIKDTQLMT